MASAGRILIMPKGDYDPSVTYEMLDLVTHNGKSWLAKKTVNGIEPIEANSEYWHLMFDFYGLLTSDLIIRKYVAGCELVSTETRRTKIQKNAGEENDFGTTISDVSDNVETILTIQNGKLGLFKKVDGVEVGSVIIAEITE